MSNGDICIIGHNGWGCEKCWRLGHRPNPTIRSIEKADKLANRREASIFYTPC
jgi:hypothetical protein